MTRSAPRLSDTTSCSTGFWDREVIPCLVLCYFDFDTVRRCLDFVAEYSSVLDVMVVENKSRNTNPYIRPYVMELIAAGKVSKYFLFDRNISNNALEVVMDSKHIDLTRSPYFLLTDGDVIVEGKGWLYEQLQILDENEDVFACGVNLDVSNLPLESMPEARNWVPKELHERETYIESRMGVQLLMLRAADLRQFLKYRSRRQDRFTDLVLARYGREILHKKWVLTKHHRARHLTWDVYADLDHPYTRLKVASTFRDTWHHFEYCPYSVYTKDSISRSVPTAKIVFGRVLASVTMVYERIEGLLCAFTGARSGT